MTRQTANNIQQKRRRSWLLPAVFAFLLFIGGVASNLLASYLEKPLFPYQHWVWAIFGVALIITIIAAIRDARRNDDQSNSTNSFNLQVGGNLSVGGDIVGGDKNITNIFKTPINTTPPVHQISSPVRDFTGRSAELEEVITAIKKGKFNVCGIHGMGGIGKTELILVIADNLNSIYPDAQIYLDLKGNSSAPLQTDDIMIHIIRAFNRDLKRPDSQTELQGIYNSILHNKKVILFLDNAANSEQVKSLLPSQNCIMLISSLERFTLPGMFSLNLEPLNPDDAQKLLLKISPRIDSFAEKIAELCGNLPIALRLAANNIAEQVDLSPSEFLERLKSSKQRLALIDASLVLSYDLILQR